MLQLSSVNPGRQTHDAVLSRTFITQIAPFLQRFRSDSEQETDVVVSSAVVSLGTVDIVADAAAVVIDKILAPVITRSQAVAMIADRTASHQTI